MEMCNGHKERGCVSTAYNSARYEVTSVSSAVLAVAEMLS